MQVNTYAINSAGADVIFHMIDNFLLWPIFLVFSSSSMKICLRNIKEIHKPPISTFGEWESCWRKCLQQWFFIFYFFSWRSVKCNIDWHISTIILVQNYMTFKCVSELYMYQLNISWTLIFLESYTAVNAL